MFSSRPVLRNMPIPWQTFWISKTNNKKFTSDFLLIGIHLFCRWNVFRARLFRESCVYHGGNYVKDLNKLGRDLQKIVIVDNSPASYIFHPENAVPGECCKGTLGKQKRSLYERKCDVLVRFDRHSYNLGYEKKPKCKIESMQCFV